MIGTVFNHSMSNLKCTEKLSWYSFRIRTSLIIYHSRILAHIPKITNMTRDADPLADPFLILTSEKTLGNVSINAALR